MRLGATRPFLLAALTVLAACEGYRGLRQEWADYEPTPLYEAYTAPGPTPVISPAPSEADFEDQVEELREMGRRWEEALKEVEGEKEEGFFAPEPSRAQALGPAERDPAAAEEVLAAGFSLGDLEILAVLRNPGVKSARHALRAAINAYSQAWKLDEIIRQYSAFTESLMTGTGPMTRAEPIDMRFPFPGVLALKGEIVTQEVQASRETLEIVRRTTVTAARKDYWNLLYIIRALGITDEMLRLLKRLEEVATTRYEAGRTSFQDVIKIRIEREKLEEDLKSLRERRRNVEVEILALLDLRATARVGAPRPRAPDRKVPEPEGLYTLALETRQELRRLRAMVARTELSIEMAETAIYPDYTLNLSLFQDEAATQVGTIKTKEPFAVTTRASRGAGLPKMPWYGTNDAYLRETKQKLQALREELKRAEDRTVFEVREAWFNLDRAKREGALYADRVVELSKAVVEVSTRGYETGEVTFADVIGSYTAWLEANLTLERKRSDLGVSWAELEAAVGKGLTSFTQ